MHASPRVICKGMQIQNISDLHFCEEMGSVGARFGHFTLELWRIFTIMIHLRFNFG